MLHEFYISMGGEPDDRESAANVGNWVYTVKKLLGREPYVNVKEFLIKGLRERGLQPCILENDWIKLQRRIKRNNIMLTPQERLIPVHASHVAPDGSEVKETRWEVVYEEIGMKALHPELLHMWAERAKKMKLHMPGLTFPFQFENLCYLASKESNLFSDEPGLGKTRQTLFITTLRCAEKMLLVVPAKLIGVWQEEIENLITPYVRRQRTNWQKKPMKSDYQIIEWADQCTPEKLKTFNIISYDKLKSTPRDGKFYKCPRCGMVAYSAKGMKEIPCPGNIDKYPEDDPRQCSNLIKAWREDCVAKGLRKYRVSAITGEKVHWNKPGLVRDDRPAKPKIPMMVAQKNMFKKLRKVQTGKKLDEHSGREVPVYTVKERDFHVKWTFAELLRWSFNHIAADESQYMKNPDTKRSQAIKHVCASSRYALTGTPIKGYPQSMLSMLNWLLRREVFPLYRDYERGGITRFLSKYKTEVRIGGTTAETGKPKQIPKINNPELFQSEIAPFMRRNTRSQPNVLRDIPKKEVDIELIRTPMDEEHRKYYQKWIELFVEWWETMKKEEEGKNGKGELLVKLGYLRNASSIPHFMLEKIASSKDAQFKLWAQMIGPYRGKSAPQKFLKMQHIVKQNARQHDKTIVFSSRRANTDLGYKWAERIGLPSLIVDGRVSLEIKAKSNRSERQERVDKFRQQDYSVMWAGLTALAEGMNIPEANHGIFMDYSWEPIEWIQALGRMIRPQQTKTIYAKFLCHEGTIDDYMAAWCFLKQRSMDEGVDYMEFDDFTTKLIPDIHQYADAIVDGTESVLKQEMFLAIDKIRNDAKED
jgi:SNF2 family DNA or RNA helicase